MTKTAAAAVDASTIAVDSQVALEVGGHEAVIRQTYKDSVGVLTWSVGMTNATGHHVERYIGNPQTLQHCMDVFAWALTNYARGVRKAFAGHKLTKAQFTAALSFHWNTGAIERAEWVKLWKAGKIKEARVSMVANWSKPASLKGRREKERDLFFSGKWSNDGTMTEYTRVKANMTPDWSSGKRVDVSAELKAAFSKVLIPALDKDPEPDAPVPVPTLSPVQPTKPTSAERHKTPLWLKLIYAIIMLGLVAGAFFWKGF